MIFARKHARSGYTGCRDMHCTAGLPYILIPMAHQPCGPTKPAHVLMFKRSLHQDDDCIKHLTWPGAQEQQGWHLLTCIDTNPYTPKAGYRLSRLVAKMQDCVQRSLSAPHPDEPGSLRQHRSALSSAGSSPGRALTVNPSQQSTLQHRHRHAANSLPPHLACTPRLNLVCPA